jgi:ribosome maturation factor RimP
MGLEEQIKKVAEERLANDGQFIVDVIVSARKGPKKVLIIMDGDQGVNIDDCADLSRRVSQELEERTFFDEAYTLEVSTPGVDQPLKLKRQYVKNIGRKLKVKLPDKIEEGRLEAVGEEEITLTKEIGSGKKKEQIRIDISFSQIEKAFVLVSFK